MDFAPQPMITCDAEAAIVKLNLIVLSSGDCHLKNAWFETENSTSQCRITRVR